MASHALFEPSRFDEDAWLGIWESDKRPVTPVRFTAAVAGLSTEYHIDPVQDLGELLGPESSDPLGEKGPIHGDDLRGIRDRVLGEARSLCRQQGVSRSRPPKSGCW